MCSSPVLTVSLCLLLCLRRYVSSEVSQEVKVKPGGDATLLCRSSGDAEVVLIKWIRPDLISDGYIVHYRQGHFHEDSQHPSYRGRVELKDPEMKDGDVSVVLKNVNTNDTGTYECRVGKKGNKPELISNINLTVQDSDTIRSSSKTEHNLQVHQSGHTEKLRGGKEGGDEEGGDKGLYVGLGVGLPAAALVVVGGGVGFISYKKHKKNKPRPNNISNQVSEGTRTTDPGSAVTLLT